MQVFINTNMKTNLQNLSTELLIEIFKYLSLKDLLTIRATCRRFNEIICSGMHLFIENDQLATNQLSPEMRERSISQLNMIDKIRISINWKTGRFKRTCVYNKKKKCMPRLTLQNDCIWISRRKYIECLKRSNLKSTAITTLCAENEADVCNFVYKQNYVISGLVDGSIWVWFPKLHKRVLFYKKCHTSDIHAIDLEGELFATGSRDQYCRIWSLNFDDSPKKLNCISSMNMSDRVWSTGFSPDGQYLLVGTAAWNHPPACLIDVERNCKLNYLDFNLPLRYGVSAIKWESPNIVWTTGYDTSLRRWDLRMNKCAQIWEDPFLSVPYCLDHDNCYTVITGVQHHSRALLWDTRQINYVQAYFMRKTSPIYSLAFDATHLYAATDCNLTELDFTDSEANVTDYSGHFPKLIRC